MASCNGKTQHGYTYFGVLFVVALIGLALAGAAQVWKIQQQREKERELLFIGQQYIDAIDSYYNAAPGGAKKYPRSMEELLRDPRYPNIKRHLRKPWRDPMTGKIEWDLLRTSQGGIAGIRSVAEGVPLKQAGFGTLETLLAGKPSYRDWKFIYVATNDSSDKASGSNAEGSSDTLDEEEQDAEADSDDATNDESGEELLSPQ